MGQNNFDDNTKRKIRVFKIVPCRNTDDVTVQSKLPNLVQVPCHWKSSIPNPSETPMSAPEGFGGFTQFIGESYTGETQKVGAYVSLGLGEQGQVKQYPLQFTRLNKLKKDGDFIHIEASYFTKPGVIGYFFGSSEGEKAQFTDFTLKIVSRQKEVSFRESNGNESYIITLTDSTNNNHRLIIPKHNFFDLQTQIEKEYPECQVFGDEIGNHREKFKRLIGILLKRNKPPLKLLYGRWGWGEFKDGRRIFYHGGRSDCTSKKCLLPATSEEQTKIYFEDSLEIFKVGQLKVTAPLVLYSLAAYMDALFTDAGYPLAHCMMLIGESGFLKTAVSKVVFSPFCPTEQRMYSIRSTEAALNVLHEVAYDDVLGVDDFNLEGGPAVIRQKIKIMQGLIRAYSDKTPRAKYSGQDDVRQYAIRGGCVFTGETSITGQLKSCELRYVKIVFPQKLKGEELKKFQEDPHKMQILYGEFIRYLERNYESILIDIKEMFPYLRGTIAISEPRMLDAYIHMRLTLTNFMRFLTQYGIYPDNDPNWENNVADVLLNIYGTQSIEAQVHEPYVRYLAEVWNLMGTGVIHIAVNIDEYVNNIGYYCGYYENDREIIMLKKDEAYKLVCDAFIARKDFLPIGIDDVSKKLKQEGLSQCNDGCLKKAPSKIPGRPRMLALIVNKCLSKIKEVSI